MKNYLLALCALVLLVGVCVLVIHYEAEQTRESMREIARNELPNLVQERLTDTAVNSGSKLPKPSEPGAPAGKQEPSQDSSASATLGKILNAVPLPSSLPLPTKPPRPADVIDGVFGKAREVINSSEQSLKPYVELSIPEERELGRRIHQEIVSERDVVKDTALYDRIDDVVAPLLRGRRRRGIDYTFTVLKTDPEDLNAFSIVGGYVYIHSAIIDFVKSDVELQSVLGHEMGHVDLGHCAQGQGMRDHLLDMGGEFVEYVHDSLARPYSQAQEFQADEYGFRAVIAAGHTRDEALQFERRFAQYNRLQYGNPRSKKKSDHSAIGTLREDLNSHFRTHPYHDDRVKRLEAIDINSPPSF